LRLILNGKPREVSEVGTVEELIQALGIHRMIVVQHNGDIVSREQYADRRLAEGDTLDIAHFVGGG
jgi:thiamine biosynthesis protein ThiS